MALINKIVAAVFVSSLFRFLISKYQFEGAAWGQVLSYVVFTLVSGLFLVYKLAQKKRLKSA